MDLTFSGDVWYWRGPAPFHFVTVPAEESEHLQDVASDVSYGWGMIPVRVRIGGTQWETSLFPKDGRYLVPLRDAVRRAEQIDQGDVVTIGLSVAVRGRSLPAPRVSRNDR
jgi:hypothetical protein